MRISESKVLIPVVEPKDYGSAGVDSDSINMGALHAVSVNILLGALTGNTTLIIYNGATQGAKTTAIPFKYRVGAQVFKTTPADQFGDAVAATSSGLVLTGATYVHKQIVVEFDSDTMTEGQPWLTFSFDNVASVFLCAACGIGTPRYESHLPPTTL